MKKTLVLILFGLKVFGQEYAVSDSINKTNPVVFIESCFGFGAGSRGGIFFIGGSLNCQFNKKDLITARYVSNISSDCSSVLTKKGNTVKGDV